MEACRDSDVVARAALATAILGAALLGGFMLGAIRTICDTSPDW